jgi:hypothetical protein
MEVSEWKKEVWKQEIIEGGRGEYGRRRSRRIWKKEGEENMEEGGGEEAYGRMPKWNNVE